MLRVPVERGVLDGALVETEGFTLIEATPLDVRFTKVSGRVIVQGGFRATLRAPCRRCVVDTAFEVPVEFSLRMVPQAEVREPREADGERRAGARGGVFRHAQPDDDGFSDVAGSFELEQVDAEPFDGKTIDLDPILREQVLLALPVSVLCRDDCRGLCPLCGQNLNEGACGHGKTKELDPRLAKLRDIKLSPAVTQTSTSSGSSSSGTLAAEERLAGPDETSSQGVGAGGGGPQSS